jgi:hypothetical protein
MIAYINAKKTALQDHNRNTYVFSVSIQSVNPKFGLRPEEFSTAVGSVQLAKEMQNAGWIKPVVQRHKLVLFDAGDVARCWARILSGELPTASCGTDRSIGTRNGDEDVEARLAGRHPRPGKRKEEDKKGGPEPSMASRKNIPTARTSEDVPRAQIKHR